MTEPCPRCNMTWGDPHTCHPPAQLVAAEARLAALVTAGDAMADMITELGEDMLWNEDETVTAWRAARQEGD